MRRLSAVLFFILLCFTTFAQQGHPPALPETETGKIVKEFADAVSSVDNQKIEDFCGRYLSGELYNVGSDKWDTQKYFNMMVKLRQQSGGITPVNVMAADPNSLTVFFKPAKGEKMLGVDFRKNEGSSELKFMELHLMSAPGAPYDWKKGPQDLAAALEARIKPETDKDQFSGVVLIAKGNEVLFHKAYGYGDKADNILNSTDTRMHIASLGKMFTSAAIAKLAGEGKLDYNDTLKNIIPDYPNKEAAENVTIHMLLTHTAGIADPFELGTKTEPTGGAELGMYAGAPLTQKPGSGHRYSNGNYFLLEHIVEEVSGMSYKDYLRDNIFKPAGMKAADAENYLKLPRGINYTHLPENDPLGMEEKSGRELNEESENGTMYYTAEDMYKFLRALKEGVYFDKNTAAMITEGKVEVQKGAPVKYGYGFYDAAMPGVKMRGHSGGGGNSGIGADAEMIWDEDLYVVVLGNYDLELIRPTALSIVRGVNFLVK